jgi:hypothetical protein
MTTFSKIVLLTISHVTKKLRFFDRFGMSTELRLFTIDALHASKQHAE